MFHETLVALAGVLVVASLVVSCQRRLTRAQKSCRRMEEYADTLIQHMQGTLLSVHGIVGELRAEDPVRKRIEATLERAERYVAECRERMQPFCPKQRD